MRNIILLFMSLSFGVASGLAEARDTKHLLPIADAMNTTAAREKLNAGVKFYFSGQKYPKVTKKYGDDFTNKKTNAFNKTDEVACEWVFLSAILQLQERALQLGANAVVNIHSYYKKIPYKSDSKYECHAGAVIAGVALKGTFVRLGAERYDSGKLNSSSQEPLDGLDHIKAVQKALNDRGYSAGPENGIFGSRTEDAIRQYQKDSGFPETGRIDAVTEAALIEDKSSANGPRVTPGRRPDDETLELDLRKNILLDKQLEGTNTRVAAVSGIVLLTGGVDTDAQRTYAAKLAKQDSRTLTVVNELRLAGKTSLISRVNDSIITGRVKVELVRSKEVDANVIKVITEGGRVYLLGLVTRAEGDAAVAAAQLVGGVAHIVKVFEYIKE